jgi:hypothetical protein
LDAGAFVRYRLDEKRLPPTPFPSLSESLEGAVASLAEAIGEVLEQLGERIAVDEEARAAPHAMGNAETVAICAGRSS